MASRDELIQFAKEADANGDTEAATKAFDMLEKMQATTDPKYNPKVKARDFIMDKLKRGVVGGTFNIPGLMVDASQLPARLLGRAGVPGLEQAGQEGLLSATTQTQDFGDRMLNVDRSMLPPDTATRYAGNVAEFAGGSILPSGLVTKFAPKPGPALIAEAGGIIGGGIGAELGGDLAESAGINRAWGAIPFGFSGASLGYAVPNALSRGNQVKEQVNNVLKNKAGKQVADIVKAEGTKPKIEASLETSKHIESVTGIPFNPTLAGRTKSKYIGDLENEVLGRGIPSAERAITAHTQNLKALDAFKGKVLPDSKAPLQRTAEQKLSSAVSSIDDAAARLAAERASIGEGVKGKAQQEVGTELDTIRAAAREAEKSGLNGRLEAIYQQADKQGVTANMDDVADLVRGIAGKDKNAFQSMPPVFRDIADKYVKEPKSTLLSMTGKPLSKSESPPATFQELHSLWKETNRQIAAAKGLPDQTQSFYLGQLKDALNAKLRQFESPEFGDLAGKFKKWNQDYATYSKTFKEGAGGRIAAGGKYGEMLSKDKIVNTFFTPRGVDDFNRIYKNDPTAKQLFEDGILDNFAKHTGVRINGEINPKTAATFFNRHGETLNKLPGLKEKLENSTKFTEALLEKGARLTQAKNDLSKGILAQVARADDVAPVIEKALTDKRSLRALMNTNEDGRKAVVHALANAIPEAAKKANMSVSEYLIKNESAIKPILDKFDKHHFKNIKTIADGLDTLAAGKPPTHPALTQFDTDPVQAAIGTTGPSLVSQYRATTVTRQSSPTHMISSVATRFWMKNNSESARKMQEYILTNPQAAKDFAEATKAKKSTFLANRLSNHAIAAGVRSTFAGMDEAQEDK